MLSGYLQASVICHRVSNVKESIQYQIILRNHGLDSFVTKISHVPKDQFVTTLYARLLMEEKMKAVNLKIEHYQLKCAMLGSTAKVLQRPASQLLLLEPTAQLM